MGFTSVDGTLHRAVQHESLPLSTGRYFVHVPGTDRRLVMPTDVKRVLESCLTADTLDGHVRRIARTTSLPSERWGVLAKIVHDLASHGLLVPVAQLVPATGTPAPTAARVSCVAFPSSERPALLERALVSYAANFQQFGRRVELVVMDDSRAPLSQRHYQDVLARHARIGARRYAGRAEKRIYIRRLVERGIDPAVASFALLGDFEPASCTTGANRNAILLDSVGEAVFMADDDTLCRVSPHPAREDTVALSSHTSPRDHWFYADRDRLSAALEWTSCDVLGEHERLLDRDLHSLAACSSETLRLDGACNHMVRGLHGRRARVIATMSGISGDSGAYNSHWLLTATGSTRERLGAEEAVFQTALQSRELLGVARSPTVTHYMMCLATTLGVANRDLLPPFFPLFRNEDGFFGAACDLVVPDGFIGHVPIAVFHDAERGRSYDTGVDYRVSSLIVALMGALPRAVGRDTRALLRSLGRQLSDLARLPDEELWEFVFRAVSIRHAEHIRKLESFLKEFPSCPGYWKRRLLEHGDRLVQELTAPGCRIPVELAQTLPAEGAKQKTRELLQRTGSLLYHWPELIDAARDLKSCGVRVSRPV